MTEPITIAIPVGPDAHHCRWLSATVGSIFGQSVLPDEIIVVDDMHGIGQHATCREAAALVAYSPSLFTRYDAPWRLGVAGAFNAGVALARNDAVFMLGADDLLLPECVERCMEAYERNGRKDAYYSVTIRYLDDRPDQLQSLPCNTAMVTKGLWRLTGGFPPESGVGAPDAALISVLLRHHPKTLIKVAEGYPLAEYRVHQESDTAMRGPWQTAILSARHVLTETWTKPEWGRYA